VNETKLDNVIKTIPEGARQSAAGSAFDIILTSPNADRMTSELARTILHFTQSNGLLSNEGLQAVLEAALVMEPDKLITAIQELGLRDTAAALHHLR